MRQIFLTFLILASCLVYPSLTFAALDGDALCSKATNEAGELSMEPGRMFYSIALLIKGVRCNYGEFKLSPALSEKKFCTLFKSAQKAIDNGDADRSYATLWRSKEQELKFDCSSNASELVKTATLQPTKAKDKETQKQNNTSEHTGDSFALKKQFSQEVIKTNAVKQNPVRVSDTSSMPEYFICNMNDYSQTNPYTETFVKQFIPTNFNISIFDDYIIADSEFVPEGVRGEIIERTDKKIKLSFSQTDTHYRPETVVTLFFTNFRITAYTTFDGGYIPTGPAWGACSLGSPPLALDNPQSFSANITEPASTINFSMTEEEFYKQDAEEKQQSENISSTEASNDTSNLKEQVQFAKKTCEDIGFTPKTEEFGNCVLRFLDK